MLTHFVNLLVQSFNLIPSRIGSNWGGLSFAAILFVITEGVLWKWGEMKGNVGRNTLIGFAVAGIGWTLLFFVSAFLTVYDDHQNLAGTASRLKRTMGEDISATRAKLSGKINAEHELLIAKQLECARQQGQNDTLQKQNRDEQVLIAGCQNQALTLLTPAELKTYPLVVEHASGKESLIKTTYIILFNRSMPTSTIFMVCKAPPSEVTAKVLGGFFPPVTIRSNSMAGISSGIYQLTVQSGSPLNPLLISSNSTSASDDNCGFSDK